MTDQPRKPGTWGPGQSGNPSGKPKKTITVERDGQKVEMSIAELAREHSFEAVKTLVRVCKNQRAPAAAQVSAATALLDRGWGKPIQTVGGDPDHPFFTGQLTPDQVIKHLAQVEDEC